MVGAMAEGLVLDPYRSTTLPSLSTRNLVKFHSAVRVGRLNEDHHQLELHKSVKGQKGERVGHVLIISVPRMPAFSFLRNWKTSLVLLPLTSDLAIMGKLTP